MFSLHNVLLHIHVLDFSQEYGSLSDQFISPNIYGRCINTKYLCTRMKTYGTNLSLKQGYFGCSLRDKYRAEFFLELHLSRRKILS